MPSKFVLGSVMAACLLTSAAAFAADTGAANGTTGGMNGSTDTPAQSGDQSTGSNPPDAVAPNADAAQCQDPNHSPDLNCPSK